MSATNEVIEEHTSDLRELYVTIATAEVDRADSLTHSQLVREVGKEVTKLKNEVSYTQATVSYKPNFQYMYR